MAEAFVFLSQEKNTYSGKIKWKTGDFEDDLPRKSGDGLPGLDLNSG
jgi:hypothetical protein